MLPMGVVTGVLIAHFIGDWLLQPRWMGDNKHRKTSILLLHACVYGLTLAGVMSLLAIRGLIPYSDAIVGYVVLNASVHFLQDGFTSNLTKVLDEWGLEYWTYTAVGVDQLAHQLLLIITLVNVV